MPRETQAPAAGPAMPTYHEPTFRSWPPERLMGAEGKLILVTLCEELDAESGRWEPFVTIRPIRTTEDGP